MAIYATGDIHGEIDVRRLASKHFPIGKELTREDYLIIAGDFGIIWDNSKEQEYWLKWLSEKPFTVCFVDGNHENFDLLNNYDVEIWNEGKVHKIRENIIHLMRGQVYNLNNKKVFTFGGADSDDKMWRTEGISWWASEMPNQDEYKEGLLNLEKNNWEVDYVITHTAPTLCLPTLNEYRGVPRLPNELTQFLHQISLEMKFKNWIHGHFHLDICVREKYRCIYKDILQLDRKK